MHICTIIAKNYVAFARVLAESFHAHHPDGTVSVLVIDYEPGYFDPATEPFDLYTPADLDIDEFADMAAGYDVLELSTAVKPWFLRHLIDRTESGRIMYLDPDIEVTASLSEVDRLIGDHGIVLIPHLTAPIPDDGLKPSETDILIAGVYNLGFIGVGRSDSADRMLDWWSGWLREHCTVDPARGYFVDQRWMDLVPGMFPSLHVLLDHGYDVAYWNVHSRELEERDGRLMVDGVPLRFYHYSGFDPEKPFLLSKHQNRVKLSERPPLARLCSAYADKLLDAGHADARDWPYSYDAMAEGTPLDPRLRRAYRQAREARVTFGSVFEPEGSARFLGWLNEPATVGGDRGVSRFLYDYWLERADLQTAYPDPGGVDAEGYIGWAFAHGRTEVPLPNSVLPLEVPRLDNLAELPVPVAPRRPGVAGARGIEGVNVAGYFRAELGVGEAARQVLAGLDARGIPATPMGAYAPNSRQGHGHGLADMGRGPYPVNVVCVNADGLPGFAREVGDEFFRDRYTIGLWWWEVSTFPEVWLESFEHLDEVWAGTAHVAEAISAVSPIPVVKVTVPVAPVAGPQLRRAALGLPEDFVFLLVYDYNSVFERKNPLAHIDAFRRAFPPGSGASLVLKSINHQFDPDNHELLKLAAAGHPDVHVIDDYVPVEVKNSLIASCDCYLSLHRSEGFGITMAEAMYFGKPVIATGYSGNLDFMTPENSFLVDYSMVRIGGGSDPYPAHGVWAEPNLDHAAELMRRVFEDRATAEARGRRGAAEIRITHSALAAGESFANRLERIGDRLPAPRRRPPEVKVPDPAVEASELIAHGPGSEAAPDLGRLRSLIRRITLRALRPYTAHATRVQRQLVLSIEELAERQAAAEVRADEDREGAERFALRVQGDLLADLRSVETALRSQDRAAHKDAVDRLTSVQQALAPLITVKDTPAGLRARLPTSGQLEALERLLAESQASPYAAGRIGDRLDHPVAGRVAGYQASSSNGRPSPVRLADAFSPPEEIVRERMRRYLPLFEQGGPVLDLRAGRGELLDVLSEAGVESAGVETDASLAGALRARGLAVGDDAPLARLRGLGDESLGGIFAAQLFEELSQDELVELAGLAARKLRPGGVLIAQSANPHSLAASRTVWVDLRARRPVFPEVALALCRSSGFGSAFYFHPNGTGDVEADQYREREFALVATR